MQFLEKKKNTVKKTINTCINNVFFVFLRDFCVNAMRTHVKIMRIKVLRQIVHLERFLLNKDVQNGVFIALLCVVTVGGFMLYSGDRLQSLSSVPTRHYGQSSYTGATGYTVASGSGVSVVSHSTLGHSTSGFSGVSGLSGTSVSSGLSGASGSSVSIGMIGHTTKISNVAFGGGGGSGSSGASGSSSSSGVSSLSGSSVGMTAMAVPMPSRVGGVSNSKTMLGVVPGSSGLGVYSGDAPGEITGAENEVMDNPIITSYGQPIGDVLWPLLLMALVYAVFIFLHMRRSVRDC